MANEIPSKDNPANMDVRLAEGSMRARLVTDLLLITIALLAGRFIPTFYDWSGSDQSRTSPVVGYSLLAMLIANVVIILLLLWRHFSNACVETAKQPSHPWTNRAIWVVIAILAVVLAIGACTKWEFAMCGLYWTVVIFAFTVSNHWKDRWHTLTLLICQLGPFVWIIDRDFLKSLDGMFFVAVPGLASILPVGLLGNFLQIHIEQLHWLGLLISSLQFVIGLWMIRSGYKRGLAWKILVLTISLISSFALHALIRA